MGGGGGGGGGQWAQNGVLWLFGYNSTITEN